MSRLTEQELVLINQARRDRRGNEAEQQRLWRDARRLQGSVMVGLIGQAVDFVARVTGMKLLARSVVAALQRSVTLERLSRLNDHMLDDIGLDRGTIQDFARGTQGSQARPVASPLMARIRAYRQSRATIRELEALDERMLADIGLVRGQIPALVKQAMGNRQAEDGPAARVKELIGRIDRSARGGRRLNIDRQTARRLAEVGPTRISESGYVEAPKALAS